MKEASCCCIELTNRHARISHVASNMSPVSRRLSTCFTLWPSCVTFTLCHHWREYQRYELKTYLMWLGKKRLSLCVLWTLTMIFYQSTYLFSLPPNLYRLRMELFFIFLTVYIAHEKKSITTFWLPLLWNKWDYFQLRINTHLAH